MSDPRVVFEVTADEVGQRLDRIIVDHCTHLTRSQIQKAFAADAVMP